MKQKRNLLLGLTLAAGLTAFGQTQEVSKYSVNTNGFWSNWFISGNVGGQFTISDGRSLDSKSKLITPVFELNAGKWFTPGLGVRAAGQFYQAKGYAPVGMHTGLEDGMAMKGVNKTKYNVLGFRGDVMLNFSNLFCGYNPTRVWNFIPYLSVGLNKNLTSKDLEPTYGVGLLNKFRLSEALDLNLDARAIGYHDNFDGYMGGKQQEASAQVLVGLSYNFNRRGWDKATNISQAEMDAVQSQLRAMNDENSNLKNRINDLQSELANAQKEVPAPVVEKTVDAADFAVFFKIGRSNLSKTDLVNLENYAAVIKNNPDSKFLVQGYADSQTGSAKLNQRLSQKRAENVYNALVDKFGVNKDQLTIEAKGGVKSLYGKSARLSRAAIVKLNK